MLCTLSIKFGSYYQPWQASIQDIWKTYLKKKKRNRERVKNPSHVRLNDEVPQKPLQLPVCVCVWKSIILRVSKFKSDQ